MGIGRLTISSIASLNADIPSTEINGTNVEYHGNELIAGIS